MNGDFSRLSRDLGYSFRSQSLLQAALTHRSAGGENNERLEFLGDGILNFVIADALFRKRSDASEGVLSRLRASLVNRVTLAALARELNLGDYIRLGGGELKSGGQRRESILADSMEAVFGAAYLDGGFSACRALIFRLFERRLDELPSAAELKDPKTRLQEHLQSMRIGLPGYRVISVTGKAHSQTFRVQCTVESLELVTEADASSRRKAEQKAACAMLERILPKTKSRTDKHDPV